LGYPYGFEERQPLFKQEEEYQDYEKYRGQAADKDGLLDNEFFELAHEHLLFLFSEVHAEGGAPNHPIGLGAYRLLFFNRHEIRFQNYILPFCGKDKIDEFLYQVMRRTVGVEE
jgi:hypothetical protein